MAKRDYQQRGHPDLSACAGMAFSSLKKELRLHDAARGDPEAEQAVVALYGCERLEDGRIVVTDAANRSFRRAFGKAGKHNNKKRNKKRK